MRLLRKRLVNLSIARRNTKFAMLFPNNSERLDFLIGEGVMP